ncbi:hypothetical protein JVU11DRAFT_4823 [Chiua virens]|nr:hypothetical protein JVU11DRAFT_4823 [Chiua virens]
MVQIDDQSFSVNAVLSRILSCSNEYFNFRPVEPSSSPATPPRTHVDLPEPPPIFPALVAAGAKPEVAQAMQAAYHQHACEFRERALATISRAYSKFAQIPSPSSRPSDETMIAAFEKVYFKKLNSWISEGVALLQAKGPSVLRCREDNESAQVKTSKTFNYQYVPLLEQFFEKNPFPTHADKVFLAKKSDMTYRQIHVWFQNRRNRTKKVSHKKPVSEVTTIPLDTPIRETGKFAVSRTAKQDAPPSGRSVSVSSSTKISHDLGGVAPRHAFPTTYPPNSNYDPFPSIPIFSVPKWPRRPVTSQHPRQSNIDVDELTEKFSRLNVWDDYLDRSRRKAGKVTCDSSAATCAITVRPSPAPHPACIRTTAIPPTPHRIICRPIPAPASALHAFRSPSPGSPMATLVPPHVRRRKICPIPKRIHPEPRFILDQEYLGHSNSSPSPTSSTRSSSVGTETSIEDSRSEYDWSSNTSASSAVSSPIT